MIVIIDNTAHQPTKMFLPKLIEYLKERDLPHTVIKGDTRGLENLKSIKHNDIKHIILSGSPIMLDGTADKKNYICNLYCLEQLNHIPIIGICFGCQLINKHFKGKLHDTGDVLCKTVNAYSPLSTHRVKLCARYLPSKVSRSFDVLMHLNLDNKVYPCLIKHKTFPMTGFMFHPEALKSTHWLLDYYLTGHLAFRNKFPTIP